MSCPDRNSDYRTRHRRADVSGIAGLDLALCRPLRDLAAIRQEIPQVIEETHRLLIRLIVEGKITGIRVDHPDGLWDPGGYFRNLQRETYLAFAASKDDEQSVDGLAQQWDAQWEKGGKGTAPCPLYMTIEKILEPSEDLPAAWPVSGTVGYEFARIVTGLFVDPTGQKGFDQWYERFIESDETFEETVYESKRWILRAGLSSELQVLVFALNRLSERRRRTRDFTLNNLRFAQREADGAKGRPQCEAADAQGEARGQALTAVHR